MYKISLRKIFLLSFFFGVLIFLPLSIPHAYAFEIKSVNVQTRNDFVLTPAKYDVSLDPGATTTEYLTVTNRMEKEEWFNVTVEDFVGSSDPGKTVILLGDEKGPYSLKDYIIPEVPSFTLRPGEQITFAVTISIPKDATPGGLDGAVLISSGPSSRGKGGAITISRLGSLFFVRVNGDAKEEGILQDFSLKGPKHWFYEKGPFTFSFLFKNSGNIHLAPYGNIVITNSIGQEIDSIDIEPYFALPDSVRSREVTWNKNVLMGRYKVELSLNRGYKNIIDKEYIIIWVLPWKFLLMAFLVICVVVATVYYVGSRFEIRVKDKK